MSSTTVCVTDTSVVPFPTLDQSSNTASGPLPHVPCRNARSTSLQFTLSDISTSASNSSVSSDSADYALQRHSAIYVHYNSGSSSSSSTPSDDTRPTIIPLSKRAHSQHSAIVSSRDFLAPITPASTPVRPRSDGPSFMDLESRKQTPLRDPSDDEDSLRPFPVLKKGPFCRVGKLRLEGFAGKHTRQASDPTPRPVASGTASANQAPQTVRKKSGQPVKSSLKSTRRPELHVVTDGSSTKSEPVTPTHTKAVHFDSKLEHVKLFLAEQKPLAVSRDGSPTSDTSGDEFPSFIYGDRENRHVKMLVPNMPSSPRIVDNVVLQGLVLSQEQRTITGSVRVRNIAYEKWLAVRFTLDWWQTTSEVTARYEKSMEDGSFDIFTFAIRLHDIWSHIEEKTIFIALRYSVAGQEYWDNNAGNNYRIKFVLVPALETSSAVDSEESLKDLKSRLEDLAKARSAPIPISSYRFGRSFSADHHYSSFAKSSSRSDFPSHETQWARYSPSQSNRHARTHTYPSGISSTAQPVVAPWSNGSKGHEIERVTSPPQTPPRTPPPPLSFGSPREVLDSSPIPLVPSETTSALLDSPTLSHQQDDRERNHRRGYANRATEGPPAVRRTPPGSPLRYDLKSKDRVASFPRVHSYPSPTSKLGALWSSPHPSSPKPPLSIQISSANKGSDEGRDDSTPYEGSQSSATSTSSSTPLVSPTSDGSGSDIGYKQFLDQFVFPFIVIPLC